MIGIRNSIAVVSANAVLVAGLLAAVALWPETGRPVAVLPLPWSEDAAALKAVAHASGALLSTVGHTVIASSDEPGFVSRLYASGSVFVLDARLFDACRPTKG